MKFSSGNKGVVIRIIIMMNGGERLFTSFSGHRSTIEDLKNKRLEKEAMDFMYV